MYLVKRTKLTVPKAQLSVQVSRSTVDMLRNASRILQEPQAQLVEEAVLALLKTKDLDERLELRQTQGHNVLVRVTGKRTDILDITVQNGVPLQAIAEKYSVVLKMPVTVVMPPSGDGGGSHEDARQDHAA